MEQEHSIIQDSLYKISRENKDIHKNTLPTMIVQYGTPKVSYLAPLAASLVESSLIWLVVTLKFCL